MSVRFEINTVPALSLPELPERKEFIKDVGIGIGAFLIEYPTSQFIHRSVTSIMKSMGIQFSQSQDIMRILKSFNCVGLSLFGGAIKVALVAYIAIIGPIVEEVLFRETLYNYQKSVQREPNSTESKIIRVVSNGVIFGACHLSPFQGWLNVPIFLITGIMGILLALLRELTGNIVASSTTHILHNSTSMAHYFLV